jgi:hypothetical protein
MDILCYVYLCMMNAPGQPSWYSDEVLDGRPGFDSREEARDFRPLHSVQTGFGTHTASYPMGTGVSFPGSKAAGAWSLPLSST